jgi:hypothetical protein
VSTAGRLVLFSWLTKEGVLPIVLRRTTRSTGGPTGEPEIHSRDMTGQAARTIAVPWIFPGRTIAVLRPNPSVTPVTVTNETGPLSTVQLTAVRDPPTVLDQ